MSTLTIFLLLSIFIMFLFNFISFRTNAKLKRDLNSELMTSEIKYRCYAAITKGWIMREYHLKNIEKALLADTAIIDDLNWRIDGHIKMNKHLEDIIKHEKLLNLSLAEELENSEQTCDIRLNKIIALEVSINNLSKFLGGNAV